MSVPSNINAQANGAASAPRLTGGNGVPKGLTPHRSPVVSTELARRHRIGKLFEWTCFGSTWFGIAVLGVLLIGVLWKATGWLTWDFLTHYHSPKPDKSGILAGLWGSVWLISLTGLFAVPVGVGAAIYLEEYGRDSKLKRIIQINLSNLAGVPSIVYGILGLTAFVRLFGMIPAGLKSVTFTCTLLPVLKVTIPLPLGPTIISGALTLGLLVLPVIIVAAQEALRAVPSSIRTASYALGATQWQTIRHQVLPSAMPGISTGVILALSRAMGESAPLIMVGALTSISFCPGNIESVGQVFSNPSGVLQAPFDSFTALPIQIYNWSTLPKEEFQHVAAAGILVLLTVLLCLNTAAILIRQRFQKNTKW